MSLKSRGRNSGSSSPPSAARLQLILLILHLAAWAESSSLYEVDDPLWELDPNNFQRIVYGKNTAWIIEFYSSWCGHCIRFAPEWRHFARDIENWKNVIEIGVVNCADSDNTNLCRTYDVPGYPTVKLFSSEVSAVDRGTKIEGGRDLTHIMHTTIEFLQVNGNRTVPSNWPNLREIKSTSLEDFWKEVQPTANTVYIVIENPESYLGRKVILDLSIKRNVIVRRMLNTNDQLLAELVPDYSNTSLVFVSVDRNNQKEVLYRSPNNINGSKVRDSIFELVTGNERVKKPPEVSTPDPDSDTPMVSHNHIFMVDIENAVRYALFQEVSAHEFISGEKLSALKAFIAALKKYFPGTVNVKSYLTKLNEWISNHRGNITGARFAQKLDQITTETDYLPKMRPYVGCKGSQSKYRGYPCSLWTLFHTLTIEAYEEYQDNAMLIKDSPQKILHDIRGYVKHFFSCRHCSEHFQKMSSNLEFEAAFPRDSVMWLWQTHNRVNKRLAGDVTEDPKNKKIQFPSEESCKKCRMGPNVTMSDIPWDQSAVLRYLRYFYKRERIEIINETDDTGNEVAGNQPMGGFSMENNDLVMSFNNSYINKPQWNFRIFTNIDVSLCFSLYLVSALLLIVIYLLFYRLSRRRKVRYRNYVMIYP